MLLTGFSLTLFSLSGLIIMKKMSTELNLLHTAGSESGLLRRVNRESII